MNWNERRRLGKWKKFKTLAAIEKVLVAELKFKKHKKRER